MHESTGTAGDAGGGRAGPRPPAASRHAPAADPGLAILDTVRDLVAQPDRDGVCRVLADALVAIVGADGATVRLRTADGLRPCVTVGLPDDVEEGVVGAVAIDELDRPPRRRRADRSPPCCRTRAAPTRPASRVVREPATLLVLPLEADGEVIGVAIAVRFTRRRFSTHAIAAGAARSRGTRPRSSASSTSSPTRAPGATHSRSSARHRRG